MLVMKNQLLSVLRRTNQKALTKKKKEKENKEEETKEPFYNQFTLKCDV